MGRDSAGSVGIEGAVGVELRKGVSSESIRIKFMFKGMECRESLKLAHTKANVNFAVRLRGTILNDIEKGKFEYGAHFPESKQAAKFGFIKSAVTVGSLIDAYMVIAHRTLAPNTAICYQHSADRLKGRWGADLAVDLTPTMLRTWIGESTTKARTTTQFLIPLRNALDLAVDDELIAFNPMDRIKLKKTLPKEAFNVESEADPFSAKEIAAILAACKGQERNVFQFAFATGMRPSEYMALDWGSVDLVRGTIRVSKVWVAGVIVDATKTASGKRVIDLRRGAYDALMEQKQHTALTGGLVFHDPAYSAGWADTSRLRRRWLPILELAKVRYRTPYQTRHTFASTLLSVGVNDLYVAGQMGHKDVSMIHTTYGAWIEQENGVLSEFFAQISPMFSGKAGKSL